MAWAWAALVMIATAMGLWHWNDATLKQNQPVSYFPPVREAVAFMHYKTRVQALVADQPGTEGSVPTAPSEAGLSLHNSVVRTGNGTEIVIWTDNRPGLSEEILKLAQSSRHAIGLSEGTTWRSFTFGEMGPLPAPVPAGSIVSVVSYTGGGF